MRSAATAGGQRGRDRTRDDGRSRQRDDIQRPSPQLAQRLIDLLNQRITPVVQSRGTLGEGDLAQLDNVGATMVGAGDAYYRGTG